MRAIPIASAALLGAAALALTTPTASAADADSAGGAAGAARKQPFSFAVTPSTVVPGGRVTLTVTGCPTSAAASSGVFDTVTIPPGQTGAATVDRDARRGAVYSVTFTCGSQSGTTDLRIAGGSAPATTRSTSTTSTASPKGVRGGIGGSIESLNAGKIATGAGLVIIAAGGIYFVVRRHMGNRLH
ncbi:hypothetical protein J4032_15285 [Streptomyces formicae]|uniref:Lipoprotein n=1 Tax=Streptomyces formicae TaxID=1616117 RepID=A0ABY3WPK1_9ACTN|nr:hypothetical protein [Streptomyces formicae]UNM12702.1 hypothetical protein J4032_15285 [Streptomyces formicae]